MAGFRKSLVAGVAFALWAAPAAAQTAYTIQGFGTHTNGTYPQVMNDAGDTAGYHYPGGQQRAFVYVGGVFSDIGTLGGSYSWITDISASGQAVGYSYLAGDSTYHAILYDGSLHDLGTFNPGGSSYATGINASGQVVGHSDGFAFLYSGGSLQKIINLLPAGSGWSTLYSATGINDAGQIIGYGYHNSLGYRRFLFTPAAGPSPASAVVVGDGNTSVQWINAAGQVAGRQYTGSEYRVFLFTPGSGGGTFALLPTLGGSSMYPYALNDAGQIVGYGYLSGNSTYHAFLYSNGQTIDLGTSGGSSYSYATGINNSGVIIGYSNGPFVYANGVMRQISNLVNGCNWSVSFPNAINNAGQITGYGYDPTFGQRGFVMTPVQGAITPTLTVASASGSYQRSVQLQARLTAYCSSLAGESVSFSLNGTVKGTAQTQDDGWARLATNIGAITPGSYPGGVTAEFAGSGDFDAANGSALLTVTKATPIIVWNPAAIVEGTPLGVDQLNAAADTAGSFFYSPSAGAVLGAGLRRLNVTFVPSDSTDYFSTGVQVFLAVRASNPQVSFTADEIGGLGGTSTEATAFNSLGQAAGYSYLPQNASYHAFLFSGGVTTDLGTFGGAYSQAMGISDAGDVTGWAYTSFNAQHAFLYSGGTMTDLDPLIHGTGSGYSVGTAMNAAGDVALYANPPSGYYHAYLYSSGTMTDLGSLGSHSYPAAINNSRQVVGWANAGTCYHAFLATTTGMQDLGTLGGSCSQATGINDNGDVIGWAQDASNQQRAFVYRNGTMTDLGTLGGTFANAVSINGSGVITGWSYTTGNQSIHAFRYSGGVMSDLGVINSQSRSNDINDAGDVVGWTNSIEGSQTGFLSTTGSLFDLNALINVGETAGVNEARFINTPGQILARGFSGNATHWYVLSPTTLSPSSLALGASAGVFGGTTTLTATLTIDNPAGARVRFILNGTQVGSAFADAQGVAILEDVPLGSLSAGTHTAAAGAIFPGDATYAGSTAAANVVVGKATPAITWNNPADISYGTPLGATQLNAASSVAGSFQYSPAAGTVLDAGDNQALSVTLTPLDSINYTPAAKTVNIDVVKASQAITFGVLGDKTYGDAPFTLAATAPGGTVTFALGAGSAGCSVTGTTVTITGATGIGQACIIIASQAGSANYNAAADLARSFAVAKANQTITFGALAGKTFGDVDFAVSATASSGGAVSFSALSGQCTVSGNSVHLTGAGSCTIRASQGGDDNYNAAPDVDQPFAIAKADQTISFAALADKTYGEAPFSLGATAPGGPVSFALGTGSAGCSVSGNTVTITGATAPGTQCVIAASQGGSANYNAAADVTRSFAVAKANQTIAFAALAGRTFGDPDFALSATATSGGTVSFSALSGQCTVTGNSVHIGGAGSCTIRASQAGDDNYNAAPNVDRTFAIAKANQSIVVTTAVPASAIYSTTFNTTATGGGSPNPVVITAGGACSVSAGGAGGATIRMDSGTGTCSVSYNQAGDANYNAAAQVTIATIAQKASQTITVTTSAPATAAFGSSFTVAATGGGSGNAIAFTTPTGDGCSDAGPTFTVTSGVTACQVLYNQAGNANYDAAPQVTQTVSPVGYAFDGFYQPVDMSTSSMMVWNASTAGQAVPLKWRLTLNGVPVSSLESFVNVYSTQVSCTTGAGSVDDPIEEYASGGSGLIYDGDGNFHYNWKTPSTYKGKCRAMYVSFNDGSTSKVAYFKFK